MKDELPIIVRYGLLAFAGAVANGGVIPADVLEMIAMDPVATELIAGGLIAVGTWAWYHFKSAARKALKRAKARGL